jgi:hypothetical protein
MTDEACWHPDLLRRFVPTPYVFSDCDAPNRLCVESNDLEIALSVRRSDVVHRQGTRADGLLCKLIRDRTGPVGGSERKIICHGALRILCVGRGTTLIHDRERSELLGFIASDVRAEDVAFSLIPALLDG